MPPAGVGGGSGGGGGRCGRPIRRRGTWSGSVLNASAIAGRRSSSGSATRARRRRTGCPTSRLNRQLERQRENSGAAGPGSFGVVLGPLDKLYWDRWTTSSPTLPTRSAGIAAGCSPVSSTRAGSADFTTADRHAQRAVAAPLHHARRRRASGSVPADRSTRGTSSATIRARARGPRRA